MNCKFQAIVTNREYSTGDRCFNVDFQGEYVESSLLKSSFHFKENVKNFLAMFQNKKMKITASGKTEGRLHGYSQDQILTTFTIQETWEEVNAENA